MRRVEQGGAVLLFGRNLNIRVAVLKAGFVLVTAHGDVRDTEDASVEAALLEELDGELERAGSLTVFADVRESSRMPSASREAIARWARRHQSRLSPAQVLVGSKLLEMATSIIAMLVGGSLLKMHSDPRAFLELVKKVAPKLKSLPSPPEP